MPYAIIRAGGHQEKVSPGEQITVDHLKQEVGEEITFTPLMISPEEGKVVSDKSELAEAKVVGKILDHVKADKIDVFQYRNKTGYRRHTGHRQQLTLVEIAEIRFGGQTFTAPEPAPEAEKPEAPEDAPKKKPAAKAKGKSGGAAKTKKAAAKKAPAKKAAAKKK